MTSVDPEKALQNPPPALGYGASILRLPSPVVLAPIANKSSDLGFSTVIVIDSEPPISFSPAADISHSPAKFRFYAPLLASFNAKFPKGQPVLGRFKRSTFFMSVAAICYILLACIIAMAVGLPKPHSKPYSSVSGYSAGIPTPNPTTHHIANPIANPTTSPAANPTGDPSSDDTKGLTNLPLPGGGDIFTGDATYYSPGLGSCGITCTENDTVVAISHIYYDAKSVSANPNANPLCGKKVRATRYRPEFGRNVTVEATVVDRCTECKVYDLDFSPYLFDKLAQEEQGRVDISWAWIS